MEIYQTEEQQVEAIKSYWQENGNMIIAGIVLGFVGFIGFNYYKDNKLADELAVSDSYQTLIENSAKDSKAFSESAAKFINENSTTSYASLTALALAKDAANTQNWAVAQTQLTAAIASAPTDGIKGIASLRLARVQVELAQYEQALATLAKPLPASFTAAVEEIKGDTYLLQGKKELARNAYQVAIAADGLAGSPGLQMKLDDLATAVNLTATVPAAK
ncbi:MAG: tetratricopeptide repeat protein [Colwellia sp.]|nr:tetratricopeptide repeat protein [Colwellia sp.]